MDLADSVRGPVATHIRRGHWRRQRVGPREEGRTELRWIGAVVVNPDGQPDDRPVAYVLPRPEQRIAPRWLRERLHGRT